VHRIDVNGRNTRFAVGSYLTEGLPGRLAFGDEQLVVLEGDTLLAHLLLRIVFLGKGTTPSVEKNSGCAPVATHQVRCGKYRRNDRMDGEVLHLRADWLV